jgi:alpha-tubulin suppressor-like RCC1 family protein
MGGSVPSSRARRVTSRLSAASLLGALALCAHVGCNAIVGFGDLEKVSKKVGTTSTAAAGGANAVIGLGVKHACATMVDQTLRCWGLNDFGQLGIGNTKSQNVPVAVPGMADVVFLSLGERHTCAVRSDGTVWCWGCNESAQLGIGPADGAPHPTPTRVEASPAKKVQAGKGHTCIETQTKTVECWGANQHGQLGDGSTDAKSFPTRVPGLTGVEKLSTGNGDFTCAVARDADAGGDRVFCWGINDKGQLGQPLSTPASPVPLPVPGIFDPDKVFIGREHACAPLSDSVVCWGANAHGQLGDGSFATRNNPVAVNGVIGMPEIAPAFGHTCGNETGSGIAKCWGSNEYGQLGTGGAGDDEPLPHALEGRGWEAVTADGDYACGRREGLSYCWGRNEWGQLGNGTTVSTGVPTLVKF